MGIHRRIVVFIIFCLVNHILGATAVGYLPDRISRIWLQQAATVSYNVYNVGDYDPLTHLELSLASTIGTTLKGEMFYICGRL